MHYLNPINPGFYPDPSICRCGENFYMVHSSFEYYPGVPIFHSRDLIHWNAIGHVLSRPSQLHLEGAWASGGIYAPTIRYHDGIFYMTTTNTSHGGNLIVHATDPRGPWSDPVYVAQRGIDPSLFFHEDGQVYFTSVGYENGRQGIAMCRVDPMTGDMLSETKLIWFGTGDRYPEGAHIYLVDGWYYLMIAEGGTELTHSESIARSRHIEGPYEGCPHNPILTHRREASPELNGVGHGDLVHDAEGQWWMVFHGYRHSEHYFHHLGRETCLAPVRWNNGWPVVNGGKPVERRCEVSGLHLCDEIRSPVRMHRLTEYDPRWCFLRNPVETCYHFAADGLTLQGGGELTERISPSMYLLRQTRFEIEFSASVQMQGEGRCGLCVFYNDAAHYEFCLVYAESGWHVQIRKHVGDMDIVSFDHPWHSTAVLRVIAKRKQYRFLCVNPVSGQELDCGSALTRYVSTETVPHSFTGVLFGLYACGKTTAHFHWAKETDLEDEV